MENQEFEIYDVLTGKNVSKDNVVEGKHYIIYYPNDKWKVRSVIFNNTGEMIEENYITLEDRIQEVIIALQRILQKQGNQNIQINYSDVIYLEGTRDGLQMNIPSFNVTYIDSNGMEVERILESKNLKDIQFTNTKGDKEIRFSDDLIQSVQIGKNNTTYHNYEEMEKENSMYEKESHKSERSNKAMNIYMENCTFSGNTTVSKGNVIIHMKQDGKDVTYDLRNKKDVQEMQEYVDDQRDRQE